VFVVAGDDDDDFSSSEVILSSVSASTPSLLLSDSDDELEVCSLVADASSSDFVATAVVSICSDGGPVASRVAAPLGLLASEERVRRDFPFEDSFFSTFYK
jgi:hypothetical protein